MVNQYIIFLGIFLTEYYILHLYIYIYIYVYIATYSYTAMLSFACSYFPSNLHCRKSFLLSYSGVGMISMNVTVENNTHDIPFQCKGTR